MGGGTKFIEFPMKKSLDSVIEKHLKKQLASIKMSEYKEVEIFLNVIIHEEKSLNIATSVSLNNKGVLENMYFKTDDYNLKTKLKNLKSFEKLEILQQEHNKILEKNYQKRVQKSNKILSKLKLDNSKNIISFDESSGIIKANLIKSDILRLSQYPEYILSISIPSKNKSNLVSAFNNTNLNSTWWPVSVFGGQGVGVFMNEAPNTCFEESEVTPIETLIGLGGGGYTEDRPESDHANKVAQSIRASSPEAHIYCSDERYSLPSNWKNSIHIVNYSWSVISSENDSSWYSEDAQADNLAYYDNVQLFISAGNGCENTSGCEVDSPGKSHNALTVGAYSDVTDRMGNFSDHVNPATGAMKPEILAPGVNLDFAGTLSNEGGTSYSSPFAAGMAASNMSVMGNFMHKRAGLIKASMLAMSVKNNIASNGSSQPDGATGIQWNPNGWYHRFEDYNSYLNDADGAWKQIGTYNLQANRNAKIALSWLNRQDVCDGRAGGSTYSAEPSHLCMDLAMKVENSFGNVVVWSVNANRNWEAGEFNTGLGGDHKVYVWRTRNRSEWTKKWPWSSKKYYRNNVKMGLRIAYIENRNN